VHNGMNHVANITFNHTERIKTKREIKPKSIDSKKRQHSYKKRMACLVLSAMAMQAQKTH